MQFVYPSFLWALAALAIPVLIHLFYFRRFKRVYFTNVRFLREVKEETSALRKVRNLLVLLARCLALAFLVFAFAQPFLPADDATVDLGQKAVSVYVDNSFSMSALSEEVPLLDKAKQRARDIIGAYPVDDRFQVLSNEFAGRQQRLVSREDALALVDEIEVTPAVRDLATVLARQQQALNTGLAPNKVAYQISDFQRSVAAGLADWRDTSLAVNLVPLQSVQEKNISIDSAFFEVPVQMLNQTNPLLVRVTNHGDTPAENIRLTLRYEGQTKPVGTLRIPAGATVTDTVNVTILRTGLHEAELQLTDYPVQFDDRYYFSFDVAETVRVLLVSDGAANSYLSAALRKIPYFTVTDSRSNAIDYAGLTDNQLVVLDEPQAVSSGLGGALQQYIEGGGNVLFFPRRNGDKNSYNNFLKQLRANELGAFATEERRVGQLNTEAFVFQDVFENRNANLKLPVTRGNFALTRYGSRPEERLLTYRDGSTYLGKYRRGDGHLYLSAAPLDESLNDLVRSGEIFVPMLYRMALSTARAQQIAYTIGDDELLQARHRATVAEPVYKLRNAEGEFIPQQRILGSKVNLSVNNQVSEAGHYRLYLGDGDTPLSAFSFNYDRTESDLAYFPPAALRERVPASLTVFEDVADAVFRAEVTQRSQGTQLWKWCLVLALLFLAAESLLLRFWRV